MKFYTRVMKALTEYFNTQEVQDVQHIQDQKDEREQKHTIKLINVEYECLEYDDDTLFNWPISGDLHVLCIIDGKIKYYGIQCSRCTQSSFNNEIFTRYPDDQTHEYENEHYYFKTYSAPYEMPFIPYNEIYDIVTRFHTDVKYQADLDLTNEELELLEAAAYDHELAMYVKKENDLELEEESLHPKQIIHTTRGGKQIEDTSSASRVDPD